MKMQYTEEQIARANLKDHKIHDIGALRYDGATFHQASQTALNKFLAGLPLLHLNISTNRLLNGNELYIENQC